VLIFFVILFDCILRFDVLNSFLAIFTFHIEIHPIGFRLYGNNSVFGSHRWGDTFYFTIIYLNLATIGCQKGDDTDTSTPVRRPIGWGDEISSRILCQNFDVCILELTRHRSAYYFIADLNRKQSTCHLLPTFQFWKKITTAHTI
jgi:hypothetical protein